MAMDPARTTQILKDAMAAVRDAGVPTELQPLALEKAIELLSGPVAPHSSQATGRPERSSSQAEQRDTASESNASTAVAKIAAKLKFDEAVVEEVFHHDDEGLRIVLGPSKFETAKRAATKQLALLFAAGQQGAGLEEWTAIKDIREVVKDFNRFDSSNHAVTISQMDDVFLFSGTGATRKVKVNRQGYEVAGELVRRLTGGEQS